MKILDLVLKLLDVVNSGGHDSEVYVRQGNESISYFELIVDDNLDVVLYDPTGEWHGEKGMEKEIKT